MTRLSKNSPRHICLADDDADDRELFVEAIQDVDPSVVLMQAEDGTQLMQILDDSLDLLPEILFLDINMPGKSGLECLEEIRHQKGPVNAINIIILSTSNDPAYMEKAIEYGASYYAVKPNSFSVLKSFLSDVLQMDWRKDKKNKNLD